MTNSPENPVSAGPAVMKAPRSGVKIRMYHPGGIGDCFLLAFPTRKGKPCYVLIDCGVLQGTPDDDGKLRAIAQDIAQATEKRLDILVATHEHWDHLSGFYLAKDIFDQIQIDQVWFGWTENPDDPQARQLGEKKRKVLQSLNMALDQLQALDSASAQRAQAVREVLVGFNGELGASDRMTTADILNYLRGQPRQGPQYLKPGDPPRQLPGVTGARVFTFGPPTQFTYLFQSDPPKGQTYEPGPALDEFSAFDRAVRLNTQDWNQMTLDEQDQINLSLPFGRPAGVGLDQVGQITDRDFKKLVETYLHGANLWQNIGQEWLWSSEALALKLDSDTNNTSLVLAIELSQNGKVLLFPGDAQAGSWLSWQDLSWPGEGVSGGELKARDLLRRVVFYKTGHHGSHNATLSKDGLELMQSPDLATMIPVNRPQADRKKWEMPAQALFTALASKTHGRLLLADRGLTDHDLLADLGLQAGSYTFPAAPKNFKFQVQKDASGSVFWIETTLSS